MVTVEESVNRWRLNMNQIGVLALAALLMASAVLIGGLLLADEISRLIQMRHAIPPNPRRSAPYRKRITYRPRHAA